MNIHQYKIGDSAKFTHTINAQDVDQFVKLTGDNNPIHLDQKYAELTPLRGTVVHGMLSASFISTIIGKHLPGPGSLWLSQTLNFISSVRVGDSITISAVVSSVHTEQKILKLNIEITNQNGTKIITGSSSVKVFSVEKKSKPGVESKKEKVVLITGAGRGIGAEIARVLAGENYKVVINYRKNREEAEQIVNELRALKKEAISIKADINHPKEVEQMFDQIEQHYGTLTALVNNATSSLQIRNFDELTDEEVDRYLSTQFVSPLKIIKKVIPLFLKQKSGVVVNISSIVTSSTPPGKQLMYTASKAALESATRSLAVEYGPKGLRFNTVSPGMTETRLIADVPEKSQLLFKINTPLRRLARPIDIANAVSFLLSDKSSYITGQKLHVNGGKAMS